MMGTIFDRDFDGLIERGITLAGEAGDKKRAMKAAEINAHVMMEREKYLSNERIGAENRASQERIAAGNRDAGLAGGLHSAFGAANGRRDNYTALEQKKQEDINHNAAMGHLINLLSKGDNTGKNDALAARDARFDAKAEEANKRSYLRAIEDDIKGQRTQHEKDNKDKFGDDGKPPKFDEAGAYKAAIDNVTKKFDDFGLTVPDVPARVGANDIGSTVSRNSGSTPGMTQQNTQQNPQDPMRAALIQGLAKQLGIQLPGQNESVHDTYNKLTANSGLNTVTATNGQKFFTDSPTGGAYARATNGMSPGQQSFFDQKLMPGQSPSGMPVQQPPAGGGPTPGGNFSFIEVNGQRMSPQQAANMPMNPGGVAPIVPPTPKPAIAGLTSQLPSSKAQILPANPQFGGLFDKPSQGFPQTPGNLVQPAVNYPDALGVSAGGAGGLKTQNPVNHPGVLDGVISSAINTPSLFDKALPVVAKPFVTAFNNRPANFFQQLGNDISSDLSNHASLLRATTNQSQYGF